MNNKQEIKDVIEGKKSQCQNKLEEEFIEVAKQAIDSFPGEITEKQVNDIDTYFSPRLCPDQHVGKIQHDWSEFERSPVFSVFEEELKAINIPDSQNIIIMILESPNKYEYYRKDGKDKNGIKHKKGEPIGPAMGSTGRNIRNHLAKLFYGIQLGDVNTIVNFELILMNAIPFQCSLGTNDRSVTDTMFFEMWGTFGEEYFQCRLANLLYKLQEYKNQVVIVNACTEGGKEVKKVKLYRKVCHSIFKVLRNSNREQNHVICYHIHHPASWIKQKNPSKKEKEENKKTKIYEIDVKVIKEKAIQNCKKSNDNCEKSNDNCEKCKCDYGKIIY